MLATLLLTVALQTHAPPSCWDILDKALSRNALAPHPRFVSYDERIQVMQNNHPYIQSIAFIDYRDNDGLARVRDERFDFTPLLTWHTEPGPPELGPYGKSRNSWLPQTEPFPVIANVRSQGDMKCAVQGFEEYKGHHTYLVTFSGVPDTRPSLKAIWVDTDSGVIWKLITSGFVNVTTDDGVRPAITDFQVEVGYQDGYLVVQHVVWDLHFKEYSQSSHYFGEYTFSNYAFPPKAPADFFASATTGTH